MPAARRVFRQAATACDRAKHSVEGYGGVFDENTRFSVYIEISESRGISPRAIAAPSYILLQSHHPKTSLLNFPPFTPIARTTTTAQLHPLASPSPCPFLPIYLLTPTQSAPNPFLRARKASSLHERLYRYCKLAARLLISYIQSISINNKPARKHGLSEAVFSSGLDPALQIY